jgi:hypothetical protein
MSRTTSSVPMQGLDEMRRIAIHAQSQPAPSRHVPRSPLLVILCAQALVSTLFLRNGPFQSEALYIDAGEQILRGAATVKQYATYFSGYPGFYPLLAGALNSLGGLEMVRAFSTLCLLIVTSCVYLVTRQLAQGARAAVVASVLFAAAGPTLFLSRLATYDALALLLLAVATMIAVYAGSARTYAAVAGVLAIAPLLALAIAAKYAALLFAPCVVVLLALQTAQQQGWGRARYYTAIVVVASALLGAIIAPYITGYVLAGLGFTTTARHAMWPEPKWQLLATILPILGFAWLCALVAFGHIPKAHWLVPATLFLTSLAAPVYHLYEGESVSLYKHLDFALFFAAPLAGYGLVTVMQKAFPTLKLRASLLLLLLFALLAGGVATDSARSQYTTWPGTAQVARIVGTHLGGTGICLCEDAEIMSYSLSATTTSTQFVGPYFFSYPAGPRGESPYLAAIHAGYFAVVELSFTHWSLAFSLEPVLASASSYRLVARIPESSGGASFMVWSKIAISAAAQAVHVVGNRLVNAAGKTVTLRGVNRDGSDFLCVEGSGIFDGPTGPNSIAALKSWGINVVRIPLNEECWLGINGLKSAYSGAAYRAAVTAYVGALSAAGIYSIVDLHKIAPGTGVNTHAFRPMADSDHAPAFWTSVAGTFKENGMVLLDLYNEPNYITWECWLHGGNCDTRAGYPIAGMQSLLDTVRAAGATNVVLLSGIYFADDVSQILHYLPRDPLHNLAVSWHVYTQESGECNTLTCYTQQLAPVAAVMPLLATEFGTSAHSNYCGLGSTPQLLQWLDQHHVAGYMAFSWNVGAQDCGSLSLISNYNGTPHSPNGTWFKQYLLSVTGAQ